MTSAYPAALDTFATNKQDDTDSKSGADLGVSTTVGDHPQHHNDLADAINKIEAILGTDPDGPYAATVRERFEVMDWKRSCRCASVGSNIAGTYATGPPATKAVGGTTFVLDGVTTVNGDRVFLKDQTAPAENGIYQVSGVGTAVVLTRTYDADAATKMTDSMYVSVEQGATNRDTTWELQTDNPITLGTTALWFSRVTPPYGSSTMDPWDVGATDTARPTLAQSMRRDLAINGVPQSAITAITSLHGGLVIPAGKLITNINMFCTAAGAGTVTTFWVALVRASDRQVLQRSTNSTTLPTLNAVHTRALQAAITLDRDTPCYLALATQVATTSPAFAGIAGLPAAQNFIAPIMAGNSSTAPTATPPTVGTVLGAPAAGNTGRVWCWLT